VGRHEQPACVRVQRRLPARLTPRGRHVPHGRAENYRQLRIRMHASTRWGRSLVV
jgi:hypothetical protein